MSQESPTSAPSGNRISIPAAIALVAIAGVVGAGTALTVQKVGAQAHEARQLAQFDIDPVVAADPPAEPEDSGNWQVFPPEESVAMDEWNPFQEMHGMHERMEKMFNDSWMRLNQSPFGGSAGQPLTAAPEIDLTETDTEYVVHVDMPGLDEANAKVTLENDRLTISGTRVDSVEDKQGGQVIRQERRASQFARSMSLPGPVDAAGMSTTYENGVLTVRIPKQDSGAKTPIAHGPAQ